MSLADQTQQLRVQPLLQLQVLEAAIGRLRSHASALDTAHVASILVALEHGGQLLPPCGTLTVAQELRLRRLCASYHVEFDADHYTRQSDLPPDYVAGWVGGKPGTIYVGVSGAGESSS